MIAWHHRTWDHAITVTCMNTGIITSAWLACVLHKLDAFVNENWNIWSRFADWFQWLSEVREIVHFFLSTFEEFVDFFLVFPFSLLYSFQAFLVFSRLLFFFFPLLQRFTLLTSRLLSGRRPRLEDKTTIPIWERVPCLLVTIYFWFAAKEPVN